jgi:hypothetical protein
MIVPMPCFRKNKTPQYDQKLNTELGIRKVKFFKACSFLGLK